MPLPLILLPRCCWVCGAEHSPEQAQHPLWDPVAQGKDDAVVHHPDAASALQPLQDLPLLKSGPPLFGTGTQTHANTAQVFTADPPSLAETPKSCLHTSCQRCF